MELLEEGAGHHLYCFTAFTGDTSRYGKKQGFAGADPQQITAALWLLTRSSTATIVQQRVRGEIQKMLCHYVTVHNPGDNRFSMKKGMLLKLMPKKDSLPEDRKHLKLMFGSFLIRSQELGFLKCTVVETWKYTAQLSLAEKKLLCGVESADSPSSCAFIGKIYIKKSQLLGRLRQENGVNPGGGACSEPRSRHCTLAWAAERDSVSKKKKKKKKKQHICHILGYGKVYGKTSLLRAHLHWHSGEHPFVCNWMYCGKKFTRNDELQRHRRTHTGEKKFVCSECSKCFVRSDHLTKHTKTQQNKKGIHSSSTVLASVEAVRDDTLITAGGTTLTLANIQQGSVSGIGTVNTSTTSNQDILTNIEIPLRLVTVSGNETME
ncbi:uncharacterized protein [Macaca fascicularis]|uniref:uncharacterized protein n=1 Tax=Macaca fascicularis TaxID=9541 RepID=UPI003D15E09C